jgi:GTPase
MAGSEGRNPLADLSTLRKELKLHDPTLATRPWLVIANKMDLPEAAENLKAFKRRFRKREVIPVSAAGDLGIDVLKARLHELIGARADSVPVENNEPSNTK